MSHARPAPDLSPPPPEAGGRVVKYVAIRNDLAARMDAGEFRPGDQLPSEHEIMALHGVSRITTRQALDLLRAEGRIEARRGKGYFVRAMLATAQLERLQSFGEIMAPLGLPTRSDVIEIAEVAPSSEVALAFRIEPHQPVIRLVRARIAGGEAVSLDESFLPLALGRKLIQLDLARRDVFRLMEDQLGIGISHADITLGVGPLPAGFAAPLKLHEGENVIRLKRMTVDLRGAVLMVETIFARLDLLQFRIRAPR
jgi:GntR family transcriptional regulator